MRQDLVNAECAAQMHFHTTQRLKCLGWGVSGHVFLSPEDQTVVKVHRHRESFKVEVAAYEKLRQLRLSALHGFVIPKMRNYDNELRLIRMDCVSPPFLLDFAGVRFGTPDFDSEQMQSWYADIEERFGPNSGLAYDVYNALLRHGICYMDLRPSNLNLDGHPDAVPIEHPRWEDL